MSKVVLSMKKLIFLLSCSIIFLSQNTFAHPHAFIEMKTTPIVKEQKLIGFSMKWLLDRASSSEMLYDLQQAKNDPKEQQKLADEMMNNIVNEHYFSYFYDQKGRKIKYTSKPQNYGLQNSNSQILYYFDLLLTDPIELKNTELTLSTYDSMYYVSMYYDEQKNAVDFSPLPSNCQGKILAPNVDDKTRQYASSLDKTQRDEDFTLGKQFAQKVIILCK